MPTPATEMPEDAVTGDAMRLRPNRKRKAATKSVATMRKGGSAVSMISRNVAQTFFTTGAFAEIGCLWAAFAGWVDVALDWNMASMRSVTA